MAHSSISKRQDIANYQRKIVEAGRSADDVEFWGARGIEGFRKYLKSKFGSVMGGWRKGLDTDGNGRISFYEFCNACRAMGYHGQLKKLWRQLDTNMDGFVSLVELDPKAGRTVGEFKLRCIEKYGDMITAWRECCDTNGNGHLEEHELENTCKVLGLNTNAHELFGYLKPECGNRGITLYELDPEAWYRWVNGDEGLITLKHDHEFLDYTPSNRDRVTADFGGKNFGDLPKDDDEHTMTRTRAWRQQLNRRDHEAVKSQLDAAKQLRLGMHTLPGFKRALVVRCGSLLGAWRESLDLDGNGRLSFGEFTRALSNLGFHGDIKGLWKQLRKGRPDDEFISFADLDPETDQMLTELKRRLCDQYGNLLVGWLKGIDEVGSGVCDQPQFVHCCERVGFSGDAKKLFHHMQPEAGRRFITLKDFDTQAYLALSRGDFRMLSEDHSQTKAPLDMTFEERQQQGFFFQIRRSWDAAQRDEFKHASKSANEPGIRIDNVEGFHDLCIRSCGSLMGAWRTVLDADHDGRVTYNEFCKGARQLGYAGSIKQLWLTLDEDQSGHITLNEIDPEVHALVTRFLGGLSEKYGCLDKAWTKGFGKDPHGSIDEAEMTKMCANLGIDQKSAAKLFHSLQPMPGRALLSIWDLDPECSRKRKRGEVPLMPGLDGVQKKSVVGPLSVSDLKTLQQDSIQTTTSGSVLAGQSTLQYLRQVLKKHYNSTVAAWRLALDPQMLGHTSFSMFCLALQDAAFYGSVKGLWQEVTSNNESGMCTFRDLDFHAATALDSFREELVGQCGGITQAWQQVLDPDRAGCIDEDTFVRLATEKFATKNAKKLFNLLKARHGQRSIVRDDLRALLITVTAEEREQVWNDTSKPPAQPSPRGIVEAYIAERNEHQQECDTLKAFKRTLVVKFGSLFGAWFGVFDLDRNGVVTSQDFTKACLSLGVKNVRQFWSELDIAGKGQIAFKDLDPQGACAYEQLEQLLVEKYGSMIEGFRQCLDKKKNKQVDLRGFTEALQELGYAGDAEKLFKMLTPEAGRAFLSMEDVVHPKEVAKTNADELYESYKAFTSTRLDKPASNAQPSKSGPPSARSTRSAAKS